MKNFITNNLTVVLVYLTAVNLIAFIVYGIDKRRARKNAGAYPK